MKTLEIPLETLSAVPVDTYGAQLIEPSRTRFRLWAPNASTVDVVIANRQPSPMSALAGGWFETTIDCGPGTRYRYRIDSDLTIADPASRAQEDGVHGASIVTDAGTYVWRDQQWNGLTWENTILHEMHVGACGGFSGVRDKLPALAALGITAIELMPIAQFAGTRNWGYDGVLPFAPQHSYGSPDELKALVDAAHASGIMVFLDVVYNHFGPDGNYLHTIARDFFRDDVITPWGSAIDFRRPEVKAFFVQNAVYWLNEFHFDGLRFDALHEIDEQAVLPELALDIRSHVRAGRHVHLVMEHDNASHLLPAHFDAQWNDDAHHALHVLLTDESQGYYMDYADSAVAKMARCLEQGFAYQGEPSAFRKGDPRGRPSSHLPPSAFVLFSQNHDQIGNRAFGDRLLSLIDARKQRVAMALVLLSPQIPLLFMGEPFGAEEPFLFFTDHEEKLAAAVLAGRRKEFGAFEAFSDPRTLEKLPDPNHPETFAASIPGMPDPADLDERQRSWFEFTGRLVAARREHVIPVLAGAVSIGAQVIGKKALSARWFMGDGSILQIALNLEDHPVSTVTAGEAFDPASIEKVVHETDGALDGFKAGFLPAFSLVALMLRAPGKH